MSLTLAVKRLLIELHRTVVVVTKTSIVHHVAHVHSAARSLCCPLKSTEGQTAHRHTAPCSLHFALLRIVLCPFSLSLFSSQPESLLPGGKRGGKDESFLGGYVVACERVRTRVFPGRMCDSVMWVVKPEWWAETERSSSTMEITRHRAETLSSSFLLLLLLEGHNSCTRSTAQTLNRHNTRMIPPRIKGQEDDMRRVHVTEQLHIL